MLKLLKCTATLEVFLELIPDSAKDIRFTCHRDFTHQNHPGWPLGLFHEEIKRHLVAALDDPLRRVAIDGSPCSVLAVTLSILGGLVAGFLLALWEASREAQDEENGRESVYSPRPSVGSVRRSYS